MKKTPFAGLILPLLFLSFAALSQNEGNIWYFGNQQGIDFSSGDPVLITNGALRTSEGCASVCDADGNLLYYTNGGGRTTPGQPSGSIWNASHNVLYDMEGLRGGGFGAVQSALFVPNPGNADEHYLFTMEEREFASDGLPAGQLQGRGLTHFLLNRTLNGGLGGTVFEDDRLHVPSFESLSGTLHGNGTDFWVIIVDDNTGDFFNYRVTPTEVLGPTLEERDVIDSLAGPIKISPARNRLFVGGVLYNFNANNGNISTPRTLPGAVNSISYSFSPNGNYLYVMEPTVSGSLLVRYEPLNPSFLSSRTIIGPGPNERLGAMQLAPDGRIYLVSYDEDAPQVTHLHAINCPNSEQANLEEEVFSFQTPDQPFLGLPNFMDYIFDTQETLIADLGPDTTFSCDNGPITLIPQTNGDAFLWSDGSTDTSLTVTEPGIYSLTVTADCGMVSDTIEVEELTDTVIVNINGPNTLCTGDTATFTATANISGTLLWSTGDTTATIQVATGGLYTVLFTDLCGRQATDTLMLNVLDVPPILLQAPDALCPDETAGASVFSEGATGYTWSNGSVGDSVTLTGGGTYHITVTNGCGEFDTVFTVDSLTFPTLEIQGAAPLCPGGSVQLEAATEPQNDVQWSNGSTAALTTFTTPGVYTVTVTNTCGSAVDSIDLQPIGCENCFYVPNAFSPNDDGINDGFLPIDLCPVQNYRLQIFSRWGELVFESDQPGQRWDGKSGNEPMNPGAYIWQLTYEQAGQQQVQSGMVHLIR
ncbi:gliding motility-associated C-terminal domain-containing protein [Phaeodactylibacter xiamenensis]|uniref:gliding motility-associated C-terminal domain-containing protein n=1 Tax=Phaeodactylibacter xiamenensis TaxID=1524460 RepID=UPI003BA9D522